MYLVLNAPLCVLYYSSKGKLKETHLYTDLSMTGMPICV